MPSPRKIVISRPSVAPDNRGSVASIGEHKTIRRLIVVESKKGSVRGNHYHKKSGHFVYMLSGKLKLLARVNNKTHEFILEPGLLVWIPPLVPHAFLALEESEALDFGPAKFSPGNTMKLRESLVKESSSRER